MTLFDWMKLGVGGIVGAALMAAPAYIYGRQEATEAVKIEAAKNALNRIENLEKNNANFRKLSDRDRCLVFMRDSGLPERECD
ncbi:hypothetical protein [Rhizobium sp. LC145]|uniref:hypothetical protein n=1 Tax=Rhizobium sp. LC145 TaxID=1120688 RepID=UPI00062A1BBD|nr:hypothetical protein [Rhizobium sp. LC145]KKX25408.1 hypothetical protein YH62_26130 [Rhizobium sp. LC145]TKT42564.1 hypothetical protein FDR95_28770 [Rhizobiaceae bacterium LC148]